MSKIEWTDKKLGMLSQVAHKLAQLVKIAMQK